LSKYLIFGNGWLGNKFKDYFGDEAELSSERIEKLEQIRSCIYAIGPQVVINCIGKTGKPNIDWCEEHKDETFFSNVTVPAMMAEACDEIGSGMIHIGSGCVYEGYQKEWTENDEPNFFRSFYSKTKIFSEKILSTYDNDVMNDMLILRIRMPFDSSRSPRNLITKLTSYKQVIGDAQNSMTFIPDMLKATEMLVEKGQTGIYNMVNRDALTHREILVAYKYIVDPSFVLPTFIGPSELETRGFVKAGRSNCVLSTRKLEEAGIEMPFASNALLRCLNEMGEKK